MTDKVRSDLNDFLVKCLYDLSKGVDINIVFDDINMRCNKSHTYEYYVDGWNEGKSFKVVLDLFNRHAQNKGSLIRLPQSKFNRCDILIILVEIDS